MTDVQILAHGKGQDRVPVLIVDGRQTNTHIVFLQRHLCCSLSDGYLIPSAERGHNNTAAKQLPLWLHPAVSTLRSYFYGRIKQEGCVSPLMLRAYVFS